MASLSLQVVLISSGILSLALLWKVSVPLVVDFSVYHAPVLWISLASWLRPPYLYVILNCIIIIIAASSRFHHSHAGHKDQQEHVSAPKITVREVDFHYDMKISAADQVLSDYGGVESTASEVVYELKEATAAVFDEDKSTAMVNTPNGPVKAEVKGDEDDFVISKSTWMPTKRTDSSENLPELLLLPAEKPLVSARFGNRKPVKDSSDGGRALRVAKLKRHETLENTWKMITEGRAMPLTRHLKKSDTFDNRGRQVNMSEVDPSLPKKSATFQDRTNQQLPSVNNNSSPPSGKLRKEPSLSQDELNRRVESFIKKFNEEMRLQRQESLNQYKEMISRGSH